MRTMTNRYHTAINGAALVFTNSERSALMCPRFYAYQYIQNVENGNRAAALSYGTIVHRFLEEVLKEVAVTDVLPSVEDLIAKHKAITPQLIADEALEATEYIDPDPIMANIEKSMIGWRRNWARLFSEWRVDGVELEFNAPILKKDGTPLKRFLPVVLFDYSDGSQWARFARAGEYAYSAVSEGYELNLSDAEMVRAKECANISLLEWELPIRVAGKVDVLLRHRADPDRIAVLDHKTTSSLAKYTKNAKYDVQLPTYAYLIKYGVDQYGKRYTGNVATVFYDLLHSKIPDPPKPLKSGKLSTARVGCPSWIFEQAIAENDLRVEDYADTLVHLQTNTDQRYFDVVERTLFEDDLDRCAGELYSVANQIADRRVALSIVDIRDEYEVNVCAPRQPHQCILWGDCKYSQICLANNQFNVILSSEPTIWFENPKQ